MALGASILAYTPMLAALPAAADRLRQVNPSLPPDIVGILRKTRGTADVKVELTTGRPILDIRVSREVMARVGVTAQDVQDTVVPPRDGRGRLMTRAALGPVVNVVAMQMLTASKNASFGVKGACLRV